MFLNQYKEDLIVWFWCLVCKLGFRPGVLT